MDLAFTCSLAVLALIVEAYAGYSQALYRLFGHPVTWIGRLISLLDRFLNHESEAAEARRVAGIAALALTLAAAVGVSAFVGTLLPEGLIGTIGLALLSSTLLAQRSLAQHVGAVAAALERGLAEGRQAVAEIVGRDPAALDEAGVARAAIESLAENFSDGVVAPAFWIALFGLSGGAAYKAANTADSMIGHRTPRHADFGWAAARFDDFVNLPASRLAAAFICLAAFILPGASGTGAVRATRRDAGRHRSPNAGWPEAAMAGALGLKLAGPRIYGGVMVDDAYMGEGRSEATASDIRRGLRLYRLACALQILAYGLLAVLLIVPG
ncbi:adenosylcobinamide-phosphate synthase [Rhizobiales bacterium GAS191]|jgi:adenosylcobinamide-phosphate synthase|nr:adenosylcobinamide-phosphate synthase [Rhizobiales bacterium GAS191]SEC85014.1 adenosylcobinamide-phosphate synthase [Rhizobiales bacterium GAS188]